MLQENDLEFFGSETMRYQTSCLCFISNNRMIRFLVNLRGNRLSFYVLIGFFFCGMSPKRLLIGFLMYRKRKKEKEVVFLH